MALIKKMTVFFVGALISTAAFGDKKTEYDLDDFLARIHNVNQEEIAAGQLAQEKGLSKKVKDYGAKLVKDHTLADGKVLKLAQKHRIDLESTLPKSIGEAGQRVMHSTNKEQLSLLSGEKFDQKFIELMKDGHDKAISLLESAKVKDLEAQKLAAELLPELKEHRQMLKDL